MQHAFKLGEHEYGLALSRARRGYRLHLGARVVAIDLRAGEGDWQILTVDGVTERVHLAVHGDEVWVHVDGAAYVLRYLHPLQRLAGRSHALAQDQIRAPMPGSLVSLAVKAGQAVVKGQTLLVMESMKMETTLVAPHDGLVQAVHYEPGQTFERDALLLELKHVD